MEGPPKPPELAWSQQEPEAPAEEAQVEPEVQVVPEPAQPWIVENIFPPGELHLLGGAPRAGKTAFECWMRSHILREEPWLGHATHAPPWWGTIIFDRSASDRHYWSRQAGVPLEPYYCLTDDSHLSMEALAKMDRAKMVRHFVQILDKLNPPPGGVLTIDVANMLAADSRATYYAGFASAQHLGKIAKERQITIIALMHGAKQVGDNRQRYVRPTDRIIANTGFLGSVGTVSYLASALETSGKAARGTQWQEFGWEPHHHAPETFQLKRTLSGLFTPRHDSKREIELQGPEESEDTRLEQSACKPEDVLELVPFKGAGFVTVGQLVELVKARFDVSERTVYRHVHKLRDEGRIVQYRGAEGIGEPEPGRWVRPTPN